MISLKLAHAAAAASTLLFVTSAIISPSPASSFSFARLRSPVPSLQGNAALKAEQVTTTGAAAAVAPYRQWRTARRPDRPTTAATSLHLARRYGPIDDTDDVGNEEPKENQQLDDKFWNEQEEWESTNANRLKTQKVDFANLLDDILTVEDPDHLPGIMTRNVDLLLSMRGYEGVSLLKDAMERAQKGGDEEYTERVAAAAEYILTFVEEFVGQAKKIDDGNKALLGTIIRAITSGWEDDGKGFGSSSSRRGTTNSNNRPGPREEALLDELFEREKANFTPGFLRHLEGECNRIASAPRLSPESARLLQTMRLIQTRVVEELGAELGEGAAVLGELIAYEDRSERLAVLDAGLTVRGVDFARELGGMTEEALEGFGRVPGGADPGLVRIVTEIDDRINKFIEGKSKAFQ